MGKAAGIVVDTWFVGFAERAKENIYLYVYLGKTDDKDVSSIITRKIAIRLISDYCNNSIKKRI